MAATAGSSKQGAAAGELPTDATAIHNILKTMGVEAHEPRVMNMLLDFMYSYVSGVLSDASAFAEQVGALQHQHTLAVLRHTTQQPSQHRQSCWHACGAGLVSEAVNTALFSATGHCGQAGIFSAVASYAPSRTGWCRQQGQGVLLKLMV
jgi:hypothetical protein